MTVDITSSVRWFAAVAAFLALSITGLTSRDAQAVRTSYAGMEIIARFVSFHWLSVHCSLGLAGHRALRGVFRHNRVLVKVLPLLATFPTVVLLAKMPLIGYAALEP